MAALGTPYLIPAAVTARNATRNHQANTENLRNQRPRLVFCNPSPQRRHVTARNVPGLMRQYANHFIGRLRLHQCAGVDEDVSPIHHEGVEVLVVDDADGDPATAQVRGLEDRPRIVVEKVLDFRIPDKGKSLRRRRNGRQPDKRRNSHRPPYPGRPRPEAKAPQHTVKCRKSFAHAQPIAHK